ncbi:MAG: LysR family transcriptional regulator [Parasphingorhabdus sp.]|uniref:LysR family transcriptional regulator n=1 Tax=Parasphingorhabdus sp. TaxID=2709688 RepID=UPI00329A48E0
MINSDDLRLISLLSQRRSIAAVSRDMHLTPSAISQRLSLLEQRLGHKLAQRNGRSGIILTSDGEYLAERAGGVLSELTLIQDGINDRHDRVSGLVSLVAPMGFGRHHIAPLMGKLSKKYPNLDVHLRLSDDLSQIPEGSWDIAIRIAPPQDSNFVAIPLAENRRILCAAPDYLAEYGTPQSPDEIAGHRCIAISEDGDKGSYWILFDKKAKQTTIRINPVLVCNDGQVALDWAINGLGIVLRSEWNVLKALKKGTLVELLPDWSAPQAPIVALCRERSAKSKRVTLVLNWLKDNL